MKLATPALVILIQLMGLRPDRDAEKQQNFKSDPKGILRITSSSFISRENKS